MWDRVDNSYCVFVTWSAYYYGDLGFAVFNFLNWEKISGFYHS